MEGEGAEGAAQVPGKGSLGDKSGEVTEIHLRLEIVMLLKSRHLAFCDCAFHLRLKKSYIGQNLVQDARIGRG